MRCHFSVINYLLMKTIVITLWMSCFVLSPFVAQVGIGTTSPNSAAILDLTSANKGFLPPRVSLLNINDVTTISSPVAGLIVYNTASAGTSPNSVTPGFYFYSGTSWKRLIYSDPDATIDFNTSNPNTGSPTFSPNIPQSSYYIYISSVDYSQWTWNGTAYSIYVPSPSTEWYINNTTTDAGSNKSSMIARPGYVTIGASAALNTNSPLNVISATSGAYTSVGSFYAPSNAIAGNYTQLNFGAINTVGNNAEWRFLYQGNNNSTNRLDFGFSGYVSPVISYLLNGNVGIGNGSPSYRLDVNGKGRFTDTLFGVKARFSALPTGVATNSLVSIDGVGNLTKRSLNATINSQTAAYTVSANDIGSVIIINSASTTVVTVPSTLASGFFCQIIQKGTGQVSVVGASGVTINSALGLKTRTQNSSIGLLMETSAIGYLSGDSSF